MSETLKKGYVESFHVKDIDLASRTLIQAYTRFDVKDSDGDIGRKGMFQKSWQEGRSRIKHLFNHSETVGAVEDLWEDSTHAYFKSKIGTHQLGNDFLEMVESGLITEASYGYERVKTRATKDGTELLEVKLWEVSSLDKWGANEFTPVIAFQKSLGGTSILLKQYEDRLNALTKFCHNSKASDKTIQYLLKEVEQLQLNIIELSVSTPAEQSLEPQENKDVEVMGLRLSIKNQIFQFQTN